MFADLGPQAVALLCVAALAAGFVDAIAGGGGLITVPALLAAGVDPVSAIATNKVQGSVGTASATWTFWRAGRIDLQAIKFALVMALVGAVAGALAVMVVSTGLTALLIAAQTRVLRQTASVAVSGDRTHYASDLASNAIALVGIGASAWLGMNGFDAAAALVVTAILLWGAISVFGEAANQLLDKELPREARQRIVDLVTMTSRTFATNGSGTMTAGPIPDALAADAAAARDALIEAVAEADEALMDTFFSAGTLTQDELIAGLGRAVRAGTLFPVFCASGLQNIGVQPVADAIVTFTPSPAERPFSATTIAGDATSVAADAKGPLGLWVWKTVADQFAGRITLFRVLSGVVKSDTTIHNLTRDQDERIGHVLALQGKTQTHVPELAAGDLGAVAKLRDAHTGDTLGDRAFTARVPPLVFPEPVLAYAIAPKSRSDEDKIGPAIQRLREEDPSIGYTRDAQTHDLLLSGQGYQVDDLVEQPTYADQPALVAGQVHPWTSPVLDYASQAVAMRQLAGWITASERLDQ